MKLYKKKPKNRPELLFFQTVINFLTEFFFEITKTIQHFEDKL